MARIVLYHGTANSFESFDEHFTLRGSEPNSGLGVHLTERPDLAAHYALLAARDLHGGDPVVLVVEAELSRVALVSSAVDYLGRDVEIFDVETNRSREEFVARRHELQDQGFDAVATEETALDDISGCWAVFDPTRLSIIGRLSPQVAEDLEADTFFPEIDFESIQLFSVEGSRTLIRLS
ncbi:hypothetical protein [Rhizobium leguminosarum]|uniref:hypothetical protein n=1 Tax=Rhizobium leguminosarum TaxID=384 RepID=UPI002E104844|nr:hypothetical protein U8Q02_39755 [Rhizobium leguminosarum]